MRPSYAILTATLLGLPFAALADSVLDSHFGNPDLPSSACYVRDYSDAHLASHPDQLVKNISLGISPLSEGGNRPKLNVFVFLRGDDYYYHAATDCRVKGVNLACTLENGAGSFVLSAQDERHLKLTVGRKGMTFAGGRQPVISGTSGDDRSFVIPNVEGALCN